jgi:hypothetical protein
MHILLTLAADTRMSSSALITLVLALLLLCGCTREPRDEPGPKLERVSGSNLLSEQERSNGWRLLFDGETFDGWRGLGRTTVPQGHWIVEDGTIRKVASGDVPTQPDGQPLEGGDLMTIETFADFELSWEWKMSEGGNSGVKYNVSEQMSTSYPPPHAALGFEYQILDDERHPDGEDVTHQTAALYDILAAGPGKGLRPVGEYNTSRIVFQGPRGEHWLNGVGVLEFDIESPRFDSLLSASKYASVTNFGERRTGHIVLQDHGDDVWFRNIKVRVLGNLDR